MSDMNDTQATPEQEAMLIEADALAGRIAALTSEEDPQLVIGALLRLLRAYCDLMPETRLSLGRALLMFGGRLTADRSGYAQAMNEAPASHSTIH